jgi:hypothetical protein
MCVDDARLAAAVRDEHVLTRADGRVAYPAAQLGERAAALYEQHGALRLDMTQIVLTARPNVDTAVV